MKSKAIWLGGAALGMLAGPAFAQTTPPEEPPAAAPVREVIDDNGVDLFRGKMVARRPILSIGGSQGLTYEAIYRDVVETNSAYGRLDIMGTTATVFVSGRSDTFTKPSGVWVATEARGQTLTLSGGKYYYTSRDGTSVMFDPINQRINSLSAYGSAIPVAQVIETNGNVLNFAYEIESYCESGGINPLAPPAENLGGTESSTDADADASDPETPATEIDSVSSGGGGCTETVSIRLASVTNGYGYRLAFTYESDYFDSASRFAWKKIANVTATNLAGCAPAPTCNWPSLLAPNVAANSYVRSSNRITEIRRFGTAALDPADWTIGYNANGEVGTIADATPTTPVTFSYTYANAGNVRTVTVTNALGEATVYTFDIASERMLSVRDGMYRTITYSHDTRGRLTRTTGPVGNYVQYIYDSEIANKGDRGNILEVRRVGKPGTPEAATPGWLVTTATFPTTCGTPATCNQPATTTDENGKVTEYTYAPHGGIEKVRLPAPSGAQNAVRPETRYTYQTLTASAPGALAVTLPATVSVCRTAATCVDGADETRTRMTFDAAKNLLPVASEVGPGDAFAASDATRIAKTTSSYDAIGNLLSVDGPIAGAYDVTTLRYDGYRRPIGTISPDPDYGGPLERRAQRINYGSDALVDSVEIGTVAGTLDTDWSGFVAKAKTAYTYVAGRVTQEAASFGSTIYARTAREYYASGRLRCTTQRMNRTVWSTTAPGCTLQTAGVDGQDRVTLYNYNGAGDVTAMFSGFGTDAQTREFSQLYVGNVLVTQITDVVGNKTAYSYDGHNRLKRTTYPSKTVAGDLSTTDYEELTYTGPSVTAWRLRDGKQITYDYDWLGRLTAKHRPKVNVGVNIDEAIETAYTYDNLGQVTGGSGGLNWPVYAFTYDALGNLTGETSTQYGSTVGSLTWQYDLAGRRTRQGWSDGFYVTYEYLPDGALYLVKENGTTPLATYEYDDLGRRVGLGRGSGQLVTTYGYAATHPWLATLTHDLSGTAYDAATTFTYNPAGQIKTRARNNDAYAWSEHVAVNRPYTVSRPNQTTQAGSGGTAVALAYDGRGNLTSSGTNTYQYTAENMLSRAPGGGELHYDPFERLEYESGSGVLFRSVGGEIATELNWSNQIVRRYVTGAGADEPLVLYDGAPSAATRSYLVADERGSVTAYTNASGTLTVLNRYDEYGIPGAANNGRFQYTGQAWLPSIGMYHYKARMYSPTLGRFMQTDPIGYAAGMNLYGYVGGDPVNFVDPTGLVEGCPGDETPDGEGGCNPPIVVTALPCVFSACNSGYDKYISYRSHGVFALAREKLALVSQSRMLKYALAAQEKPQKGLLDRAKDLYCSLPSFGGGATAGGYAGLGGGVTGEVAFDPGSGRISLSAGLNVGVGVGFSAAGTANTGRGVSSNPVFGGVGANANVAAGPVRFGAAATVIDSSGFNPRFNGVNGGLRAGGGLTANANLTARGGGAFQILPSCK